MERKKKGRNWNSMACVALVVKEPGTDDMMMTDVGKHPEKKDKLLLLLLLLLHAECSSTTSTTTCSMCWWPFRFSVWLKPCWINVTVSSLLEASESGLMKPLPPLFSEGEKWACYFLSLLTAGRPLIQWNFLFFVKGPKEIGYDCTPLFPPTNWYFQGPSTVNYISQKLFIFISRARWVCI